MVTPMDTKRPDNRDLQDLLEKKKDLLSLFSAFEDRIDHKISHLTDSTELPTKKIREATNNSTFQTEPKDDIFEQAVLKSQQPPSTDGIIGYHTEEILGIDAALAALDSDTSAPKEAAPKVEADTSDKNTALNTQIPQKNCQETASGTEEKSLSDPAFISDPSTEPEATEMSISNSIETITPEPQASPQSEADTPKEINPHIGTTPNETPPEPQSHKKTENLSDLSAAENEAPQKDTPLFEAPEINPETATTLGNFDGIPTEHPNGAANAPFGEISDLLNEAEDLIDVTPYSRYIASQTANIEPLDDVLKDEPEPEASQPDPSDDLLTEDQSITTKDDETPNAFDAFFENDDDEDSNFESDAPYEDEPLTFKDNPEASLNNDDLSEESDLAYTEEDTPQIEAEANAPYADFFDDNPTEKEDFFDDLSLDKAPEEEHLENNLDDVTYENVDAQSLGAFKYSAVSLRLALFVIAMLGMGVFAALSGGKFIAMDYLILLVLCICTALTMDMSLNATLVVTVILMIASFGGIIYTFITGGGFDLYHLFWFILIPAILITASSLVQKVKEVILANQLLNEELGHHCPEDIEDEDDIDA